MGNSVMKTLDKSWHFYRSHFAGNPCATCRTCNETWVYWETDDLKAHTEQHEQETTNDNA